MFEKFAEGFLVFLEDLTTSSRQYPDEVDQSGNPMLINPNYGTSDADKILTVDVDIID